MKQQSSNQPLRRKPTQEQISIDNQDISAPSAKVNAINWKRILLLIIAITIHNIPGKLCRSISALREVTLVIHVYEWKFSPILP